DDHGGDDPSESRLEIDDCVAQAGVASVDPRQYFSGGRHLPHCACGGDRGGDHVDPVLLGQLGEHSAKRVADAIDLLVGDELVSANRVGGYVSFQGQGNVGEQIAEKW